MLVNYIIGGLCIVVSFLIPFFYYLLVRSAVSLSAVIDEELPFDNLFGQKIAWIISINYEGVIRRLFNTIYKSKKNAPKVGDSITISKVKIFGKVRYLSKFQSGAAILLIICQAVLLWLFALIAFGFIQ